MGTTVLDFQVTAKDQATQAFESISNSLNALQRNMKNADEGGRQFSGGLAALAGGVAGVASQLAGRAMDALGGFISEAVAASDATTKFKQTLNFAGVDGGTIDTLTKQTRSYADRTVYDLQTIQNTTAQLAANSVPNYEALTEAAGNLNAVAGGNADTFRSVAMVLTQTAGAGKLTTENWNQLADAIPGASGKLQEAMLKNGAFTGNFRDAMEKGQISAEEFNKALMELGNQPVAVEAAQSTQTFEGALGNLKATITGGLSDAINGLKPMLTGAITSLSNGIGGFFGWIKTAYEGVVALFGNGDFTAAFRGAFGISEDSPVIDFLLTLRNSVMDVVGQLAPIIGPLIPQIVQLGMSFSPMLLILQAMAPVLPVLVKFIGDLAATVIPMLVPILTQLAGVFQQVLAAVVPIVATLVGALAPILQAVVPLFGALLNAVLPILQPILDLITPLLQLVGAILQPLIALLTPLIQLIASGLTVALQALTPIIAGVVQFIRDLLLPIIDGMKKNFELLIQFLVDVFTGNWEGAWRSVREIFENNMKAILEVGKVILNGLIDIVNGMIRTLNGAIGFAADVVKNITGSRPDFQIPEIPHLASGGMISRGGLAVVGERGPELVSLPTGSRVHPTGTGPGDTVVNVHVTSQADAFMIGREVGWALRAAG